jgi:hypothetical protein
MRPKDNTAVLVAKARRRMRAAASCSARCAPEFCILLGKRIECAL